MTHSTQSQAAGKTMFQMFAAVTSMAVTSTVLLGWITNNDEMTRILSKNIAMNPMTAICLMAVSTALLLRGPRTRPLFFGLAALTIMIGATKFIQFGFNYNGGLINFYSSTMRSGRVPHRTGWHRTPRSQY